LTQNQLLAGGALDLINGGKIEKNYIKLYKINLFFKNNYRKLSDQE
jgi:hypothetical protein